MPDNTHSSSFLSNSGTIARIESFIRGGAGSIRGLVNTSANTSSNGSGTPSPTKQLVTSISSREGGWGGTMGAQSANNSPVKRKPLPKSIEDNLDTTTTLTNADSDSGSTSSISLSLRHRKPSQNSSLLDWMSTSSAEQKPKAADIMLHLDENKLNELLEEMLDQIGMDETKRVHVRQMPKDSKWMMVYQHLQKQDSLNQQQSSSSFGGIGGSSQQQKGTPEYYTKILRDFVQRGGVPGNSSMATKTLNAIRVSLANQPIAWTQQFINRDGLRYLLEFMDKVLDRGKARGGKDADQSLEVEISRCIKAFMNNKLGLREIMDKAPKSIRTLTRCLISASFVVTRQAAELLTVICYTDTPHGHKLVMDALEDGQLSIYHDWIRNLVDTIAIREKIGGGAKGGLIAGVGWVGDTRVTEKEVVEYLISNMMLINALVGIAEDVDYRTHIRNRFYQLGFSNIFLKLQELSQSNEILRRQVDQFNRTLTADGEIYQREFEDLKRDMSDPENILRSLIRTCEGSRGYNHLLSILQHLLAIRKEPAVRSAYLHLIDLIISQIVLSNKGIDPDFSSAYPIDLGIIIDNFVHHDEITRLNHENALLKQMVEKLLADKSDVEQQLETYKLARAGDIASGKSPALLSEDLKQHYGRLERIVDRLINASGEDLQEQLRLMVNERQSMIGGNVEGLPERHDSAIALDSTVGHQQSLNAELTEQKRRLHHQSPNQEKEEGVPVVTEASVPPPPPPPFVPNAPPPPPGMMGAQRKPAKPAAYIPRSKLKQLQWVKIPDHEIKQTFWHSIESENEKMIADKLGNAGVWHELEQKFCAAEPRPSGSGKHSRVATTSDQTINSQQQIPSLLNPKKSYNIMILLSRVKQSIEDLGKSIVQMNTEVLNPSLVQQFIRYFPTAEEAALLAPYLSEDNDERKLLPPADRFVLEMMRIDKCLVRLRALNFKSSFDERFFDLENGIAIISEALDAISTSALLKEFLQLLLVVGNVLNGKGFRGGAYGFRIQSLNSLQCTKSSAGSGNSNETLLDFISAIIVTHFPKFTRLADELEQPVTLATRISMQFLKDDFAMLYNQSNSLHADMSKSSSGDAGAIPESDPLHASHEFVKRTIVSLDKVKVRLEDVSDRFNSILLEFGDDSKEFTTEDWFGQLKTFLLSFKKSVTIQMNRPAIELDSSGVDVEGESSGKIGSVARVGIKSSGKRRSASHQKKENGEEKGIMDDLLNSLRDGNLPKKQFQQKHTPVIDSEQLEQPRRVSFDFSKEANDLLMKLNEL